MSRGWLSFAALLVVGTIAVVALRISRSPAVEPPASAVSSGPAGSTAGGRVADLTLLVLETRAGPLVAVVGSGGKRDPAALVVPSGTDLTIPGQGDATVADAAVLPERAAATAISNLLGVWIPHGATLGTARLAAVIDRVGGIEVGGAMRPGSDVVSALSREKEDPEGLWRDTLTLVLGAATWEAVDLPRSDDPAAVADALNAAGGAAVVVLPTQAAADGSLHADQGPIRSAVASAFGVDASVQPVIVLNGSGVPGIGEQVAERLIPGGFQVVVSENASSFDHETTLVVVSGRDARPLGERVRDLLGVGEVRVAGSSSDLAEVTVVVGKDFGV